MGMAILRYRLREENRLRTSLWRAGALAILGLALALPALALPKPGSVAPAFTGNTTAGKPLKSTQFKGKVVLLNFFSFH